MGARLPHKARVLVLYGSLRESSFSRKLAHECARLLELMGADVRVFNPQGLPVRDPALEDHPKVQVKSRTHAPQKLTGLFLCVPNPYRFQVPPFQTVP